MVLIARQAAVVHIGNLRVAGQKLCHSLAVLAMAGHAHMQAFQAKVEHVGVDGALHAAKVTHQLCGCLGDESALLAKVLGIGDTVVAVIRGAQAGELIGMSHPVELAAVHNGTAQGCAVAVHVLGGGMGHDIGTPFNGAAVDGGGKGVIHNQRHTVGVGCIGKLFNIQHRQGGVGNGFAKDSLGVGLERGVQLFLGTVRRDKGGGNAHLCHGDGDQVEGAAVNGAGRNDVVARVADVEQGKEVGCLAGTGQHTGGAALQFGNLGGDGIAGGVLQAGIKITAGLQVKQLAHIVGAIIFESGALHNGNLAGFAVAGGIAALYAQGIDAVFAGLIHDLTSFPQKR